MPVAAQMPPSQKPPQSPRHETAPAPPSVTPVERGRRVPHEATGNANTCSRCSRTSRRDTTCSITSVAQHRPGWRRKALRALAWGAIARTAPISISAPARSTLASCSASNRGFIGLIVGADFAVPMLQHGRGKASRSVLAPVGADALALPLADDSIDGAIVAFGIRNVADLDAGLREV